MFGFGDLNEVKFIGNCGEVKRRGTDEKPVMAFGLAINKRVKQGDEYVDKTNWFNCVVFGKTAEIALKWVEKGSKVYVSGELENTKWQDDDGNDRYGVEVIVRDIQKLADPKNSTNGSPESAAAVADSATVQPIPGADLPF